MESRAKLFGHALHPMLVVLPLGTLVMAVIFDIVGLISRNGDWHQAAFWMIGAGVISGVVAAIPGLVDLLHIPGGTRAKTIGIWHGVGNLVVLLLFAIAWLMRRGSASLLEPDWMAITLGIIAIGLGTLTAWLGGELVERLGIGVDRGANVDAPSSLSGSAIPAEAAPVAPTGAPVR
jgi:uncharacterized membrane protein